MDTWGQSKPHRDLTFYFIPRQAITMDFISWRQYNSSQQQQPAIHNKIYLFTYFYYGRLIQFLNVNVKKKKKKT
jgi:hypothetical protein